MESLLQALSLVYSEDPTMPGVQIAFLKAGVFYVALHRYKKKYGDGRCVLVSVSDTALAVALAKVTDAWVEIEPRAAEALAEAKKTEDKGGKTGRSGSRRRSVNI